MIPKIVNWGKNVAGGVITIEFDTEASADAVSMDELYARHHTLPLPPRDGSTNRASTSASLKCMPI